MNWKKYRHLASIWIASGKSGFVSILQRTINSVDSAIFQKRLNVSWELERRWNAFLLVVFHASYLMKKIPSWPQDSVLPQSIWANPCARERKQAQLDSLVKFRPLAFLLTLRFRFGFLLHRHNPKASLMLPWVSYCHFNPQISWWLANYLSWLLLAISWCCFPFDYLSKTVPIWKTLWWT